LSAEPNPEGYVLCVRRDVQTARRTLARLELSGDATKLVFELKRADGRVVKKGAVESPEVPANLRGLLAGADPGSEVYAEVSAQIDWAIAARFVAEVATLRAAHRVRDRRRPAAVTAWRAGGPRHTRTRRRKALSMRAARSPSLIIRASWV
jgi:hypothetical protein